jgi:phage terminase large subunit
VASKIIDIPVEYEPLFNTAWREAAIYGGRYSLKSHTVARSYLIKARLNKRRIGCFREFQNSIADSSHKLLADLIALYELTDFKITDNSILNTRTGSEFLFRGLHHNEQSIKSIEGLTDAWVEEAQTVSKESIDVLTPTVRLPGSQIIYTYNRLLEEDPVHKRLVLEGRPNTLIINVNYDIAEKYGYLPKVIKDEIEDDKLNRPSLYKHKWLGEPNSIERRVYKDWVQIDEIPHEARIERRGLDFGFKNDPTAVIGIYYYNGGYILDEELYRKGMHNNEIAAVLNNLSNPNTLVVGDSAEPKSIDELRLSGVNILGVKKVGGLDQLGTKKSFKQYGIDFIGQQKISVTKRSQNIWREYLTYLHKEDKDGRILNEPEDGNDHAMDATLYGFMGLRPQVDEEEFATTGGANVTTLFY